MDSCLKNIREDNDKLVSESEKAKKMLSGHQKQMDTLKAKHLNQILELNKKLRIESDASIGMKQEIENKEIVNSDLRVKNREISDYNNILIESNLDNLDKIKSYETVMNEEYQFLLRDLCVQIDFSKIKLEI